MISGKDIQIAEERIRPYTLITPLLYSALLSERTGAEIYLKMENRQHTGSFKARGAMNKILSLHAEEKKRPIITASTGNHGLGVARALQLTGLQGTVYIPENASPAKVAELKKYPVELVMHGSDPLITELYAKEMATQQLGTWISPYNDPMIIAGQGTIGPELTGQLENIDMVYVTVGGGGLISGLATWLAENSPDTEIIGCLPENSPEMKLSVEAGEIVHLKETKETLSDGSAGGMEDGSITFPICQRLVDRFVVVSEEEIALAMREVYIFHNERIEGSAGVAVAAILKDVPENRGKKVVAVICGGNVTESTFQKAMNIISEHKSE